GAARGIGSVVCAYLAQDGAHVALAGRSDDALRARAAELDEEFPGRDSLPVRCDVTDEEQVQAMVSAVTRRFGGLDILVNSAGGTGPIETAAQDYPAGGLRRRLDLHVRGTVLPRGHAIPHRIGGRARLSVSGRVRGGTG